ncbi:MAG: hypothetical protein Q8N83_17970 [Ignavibacteria bacterium]|nr:hypothetical protein [Ignavibacteria bacterium]
MQLYLNELAPWERKKEYYNTIQLRNDIKKQNELLSQAAKQQVISQLSHTDKIIASQDRVSSYLENISFGMSNLSNKLDNVVDSVYDLKSTFEWGISEVVWQLEQNRKVLKDILEILMAPLDTQAKERKKRAIEAYSNDWIDDAEEEFIESEKLNKYDFSIHISLGMIYLFNKIDKIKALDYFAKAIKYSKPKSSYYASYSLLYYALIKFDMHELEKAEEYTQEAINLSPNFLEAYYQNAQYNAQLGRVDKAIKNLENVIKKDKFYSVKADNDKLFDPIRKHIQNLITRLRDENYKIAREIYENLIPLITKFNSLVSNHNSKNYNNEKVLINIIINNFQNELNNLSSLFSKNTFFDSIDYLKYAKDFQKQLLWYFQSIKDNVALKISSLNSDKEHNIWMIEHENRMSEFDMDEKKDKAFHKWLGGGPVTGGIAGYIIGLATSYDSMVRGIEVTILQILAGIFWLLLSLIPAALGALIGLLLGSVFGAINKLFISNNKTISKNEEKKSSYSTIIQKQLDILFELKSNLNNVYLPNNKKLPSPLELE